MLTKHFNKVGLINRGPLSCYLTITVSEKPWMVTLLPNSTIINFNNFSEKVLVLQNLLYSEFVLNTDISTWALSNDSSI